MLRRSLLVALALLLAPVALGQVCAAGDLTLRSVKGAALTHNELDANFTELGGMCTALSGLDAAVITGTPGANGTCAIWNTDGDLVSTTCVVDTDTTCNDAGVNCLFAASATEGGAATTGDSATSFFAAGTLEHERGGLEVDASAFGGLVRIAAGSTSAVSTLTALNTALSSSVADGAHTTNTNAATICTGSLTYLDGEGNCDAYTLSGSTTTLGTTSGALTSGDCVEFDASGNLVAAGAACGSGSGSLTTDSVGTDELDDDANTPTAGDIVVVETGAASFDYLAPASLSIAFSQLTSVPSGLADGDDDTIFTPNADPAVDHASYVAGHGNGANCSAGNYPLGVDAAGAVEGCTADDTGTDDQVGAEVPLTDAGTFFTTGNVEAALQEVGPTMTDARAPTDDSVDADALADGDLGDVSVSAGVVTVDPGAVGITELGDDATCAANEVVARNAGDTAFECQAASGGSSGFADLASGTNTTAAMVVGAGASLKVASTGTIDASAVDTDGDGNPELYCSAGTCFVDYDDDGAADLEVQDFGTGRTAMFFRPDLNDVGWVAYSDNDFRMWLNGAYFMRFANSDFHSATARSWMLYKSAGTASRPTYSFFGDENTGIYSPSADTLVAGTGGTARQTWTDTETTIANEQVNSPSSQTCADDTVGASPGALTLTASGASYVALTSADPDGCTVTLSETGATNGQRLEIVVVSNAGGTVDFSDTAGVSELSGAFSAGVWDSLTLRYSVDRFTEISRSDN